MADEYKRISDLPEDGSPVASGLLELSRPTASGYESMKVTVADLMAMFGAPAVHSAAFTAASASGYLSWDGDTLVLAHGSDGIVPWELLDQDGMEASVPPAHVSGELLFDFSLSGGASGIMGSGEWTVRWMVPAAGEAGYGGYMRNPMSDAGDLIVAGASGVPSRLAAGTDGQVLAMDGDTPRWETPASGAAPLVAEFNDTKGDGVPGGGFTSGSWVTRTLNTTLRNNISGCSLSSNAITVPAGTYHISASAPSYNVGTNNIRLYNVTTSSEAASGVTFNCQSAYYASGMPTLVTVLTFATETTLRIEHKCEVTKTTNGLGIPGYGSTNTYAYIMITKL
jgi:hypothetical protein